MNMEATKARQAGFGFGGVIALVGIFGLLLFAAIGTAPIINENLTIREVVGQLERSDLSTERELRVAFEKRSSAEYITSLRADELQIERKGELWKISYKYEARLQFLPQAALVLSFSR